MFNSYGIIQLQNSDSTVKIPIEIIDIHYNYNRGYASGKFMVEGSDIYVLDQFNKRHELKRNKETNQIETNFYDETDEPLAVSIKGYERILPIDKFLIMTQFSFGGTQIKATIHS